MRGHNTGFVEVVVLILCVIVKCCICQLYPDDACLLDDGNRGICTHVEKCPEAVQEIRRKQHPKICSFQGKYPIVCCRLRVGPIKPVAREPSPTFPDLPAPALTSSIAALPKFDKRRCPEFRISVVGGEQALNKEFPHMAALGFGDKDNIRYQCGGSLISETYVITAAHCLYHPSLGEVRYVRLGDLDLNNDTDDAEPQDFTVTSRIPHPQYKPPVRYHDIALIRLDRPVRGSSYVSIICLQTKPNITNEPIATGWGRTEFAGEASSHLLKVTLAFFTNEECRRTYSSTSSRNLPNGIVNETQLCAGNRNQPKDTCQGDSGGPLQTRISPNSQWTLAGVTSFGRGCGTPNVPGVYTRVSYYVPWITSIVWGS